MPYCGLSGFFHLCSVEDSMNVTTRDRNNIIMKYFLSFIILLFSSPHQISAKKPHIILIVADDLGWNDVSFHGSNQIPTPNIDSLAYSGIILNNYYVDAICTPSRSALMTGRHPIHTGLQEHVLVGAAPYALSTKEKLIPEYLNTLGYNSHAIGKWHLGSHKRTVTPTFRGFKSHVGYWTGHEDYYDHSAQELYPPVAGWGYDFRRNMSIAWDDYGEYATDIFTKEAVKVIANHDKDSPLFLYLAHLAVHSGNTYAPLQAPEDAINKHSYITDTNRRTFSGMLSKLDDSVGAVVESLQKKGMLQDSIIVFTSDNGGPAAGFNENAASNWPLRGVKDTLWEGGVRGAALVWSPLLKTGPRVSDQMMNIQDWLPTLYSAAGGDSSKIENIDGLDMWTAISRNLPSPRNLMLHNIDEDRHISAVRVGDWKLMKGTTYSGEWDSWYGPSGRDGYNYSMQDVRNSKVSKALEGIEMPLHEDKVLEKLRSDATVSCTKPANSEPCKPLQQVCLFNVTADPCEFENLVFKFPDIVKTLDDTIDLYKSTAVPPRNKPLDPRADPKYWDYAWTNWCDYVEDGCGEDDITDVTNVVWDPQIQNLMKDVVLH
ncbi:arylsulfatase B isoform X1 [Eurytemora carolleeae]|uniref:arylsulfatase B isoform X1 n=1 Tax=Eurytemora carolleeae TaxID=1294199 RepID=UPI000C78406E|nr:arylsulfatase B isoform X1 [Eurytemora carolleeae]|eukprot:XP_023319572.1 arylsulfatase B-like isoform X1 [Eurytemora affinis]